MLMTSEELIKTAFVQNVVKFIEIIPTAVLLAMRTACSVIAYVMAI